MFVHLAYAAENEAKVYAPFTTAPAIPSLGSGPGASSPVSATPTRGPADSQPKPEVAARAESEVGFPGVLLPDEHPWKLAHQAPGRPNALYLDMPSATEIKMMLPGRAADVAERTRSTIAKYFSDATGIAALARGRQAAEWDEWVLRTAGQALRLPKEPWPTYEFWLEANKTLLPFKENLSGQTAPSIIPIAEAVRGAITQMAPLVRAFPTYALQLSWYRTMAQLKDGFELCQNQIRASDAVLLAKITLYLRDHPIPPKPAGAPPVLGKNLAPQASAQVEERSLTSPSLKPSAVPVPLPQEHGSAGSLLAVGLVLALGTGAALYFRKKQKVPPLPA